MKNSTYKPSLWRKLLIWSSDFIYVVRLNFDRPFHYFSNFKFQSCMIHYAWSNTQLVIHIHIDNHFILFYLSKSLPQSYNHSLQMNQVFHLYDMSCTFWKHKLHVFYIYLQVCGLSITLDDEWHMFSNEDMMKGFVL